LFLPLVGLSQKVFITDTQSDAATQIMDLSWKRAANLIGAESEIIAFTTLDSLHILQQADVVILASGIKETSVTQRNVLQQYIQEGGNVYVQSEFKINFAGNQLFSYLVNKSGGEFEWSGETSSNLNPISFPAFISGGTEPSRLNYFWNGTSGCGGETVFPIATHNDIHYGFIHIDSDPSKGRIMTISDQDWIKIATEVGQGHRLTLMKNLLNTLANGIQNLVTPDVRISFLQQSLCPNTPYDIEAKIDETVLSYELNWFKNGTLQNDLTNKASFESTDLKDGDILQAKIDMLTGCVMTAIESNIVEIERVYPLSMSMPSIIGNTMICSGDSGLFVASIDEMPDPAIVTYSWKVDGMDQMVNNDTLIIDNPKDESVVELSVSFNDGCTMVNNSTESVTIAIIGKPIPTISLNQDKPKYCNGDDAVLELVGIVDDPAYAITWNVNGQVISDQRLSFTLPIVTNDHEVYASISYTDPCKGVIQLSTQIASISIDQPMLRITNKQNTSCNLDNGIITVNPEGGTAPYTYMWNSKMVSNSISEVPMGMQTIQVTDANGCTAEVSTSIGSADPTIIDSLVIMNQTCDHEEIALVQLYPNPAFSDDITIQWTKDDGNALNDNFTEGEFEPGAYTVVASINEGCIEERQFTIESENLEEQMKKTFETEAEFFITLDLGIDVNLIQSIKWTGQKDVLNCNDCTWPSFLATKDQLFQVELETTSGCIFNFDVKVNVNAIEKQPYFAPSGFSPDGDGDNEQFEFFTDPTIASLQELLIFDRWGNMVYEAQEMNTNLFWDGNVDGNPAERGVYVYVAKMQSTDGKEIMASGSIMLVR